MSGVLKGTSLFSVVAASGLCIALIPLGFKVLNLGEKPSLSVVGSWTILIVVLTALLYFWAKLDSLSSMNQNNLQEDKEFITVSKSFCNFVCKIEGLVISECPI
ncbi:MAG: hypothetical protein IPN72_23120 [Saprospiraceae bacterium]|nr:hypothetical protein [Saprospiraceae bacterium]